MINQMNLGEDEVKTSVERRETGNKQSDQEDTERIKDDGEAQ